MEKITHTIEAEESYFNYIMKSWHNERKVPEGAVMVLPRPGGKVLVMTKTFYPQSIYRLPSGGMHKGETPEEGYYREVQEETGLNAPIVSKIAEIEAHLIHQGKVTSYRQHVYLASETSDPVHTEDESEQITDFKEISIDELLELAEELRSLPEPWQGWGQFWAMPHEAAYRALKTEDDK